eukprot:jgi/Botrbrau1/22235/Bobra.0610s0002.1
MMYGIVKNLFYRIPLQHAEQADTGWTALPGRCGWHRRVLSEQVDKKNRTKLVCKSTPGSTTNSGYAELPGQLLRASEADGEYLPIFEVLPEVQQALEGGTELVLEAPPGAGKTTAVPLALLLAEPPWLTPSSAIWVRLPLSPSPSFPRRQGQGPHITWGMAHAACNTGPTCPMWHAMSQWAEARKSRGQTGSFRRKREGELEGGG